MRGSVSLANCHNALRLANTFQNPLVQCIDLCVEGSDEIVETGTGLANVELIIKAGKVDLDVEQCTLDCGAYEQGGDTDITHDEPGHVGGKGRTER